MNHRFNLVIKKKDSNISALTWITGINIHNAFQKIMNISDLNPNDFLYTQVVTGKSLWYEHFKHDLNDVNFDKPISELNKQFND